MADTGLRISDTIHLTKGSFEDAKQNGGYLKVKMIKTGEDAHVMFSPPTLKVIDDYICERGDNSPWIFIQHGRGGKRKRKVVEQFYKENYSTNRGYGMRLGDDSARSIIWTIANKAGYKKPEMKKDINDKFIPYRKGESDQYVSPHAFRHWLATSLKNMDMPIDDIQNILGHKSPETTKMIYAPKANEKNIKFFLNRIHSKTHKDLPKQQHGDNDQDTMEGKHEEH